MIRPVLVGLALAVAGCSPADGPGDAETAAPAAPIASPAPAPASDPALEAAIATVLGQEAASTRTVVRVVGVDAQRLALVYLVGPNWCGTGGCNLLILRPEAEAWVPVGNVGRVSNPVRLLETSTNGLPDIGVTVSGGGGPPPYEARLAFDGQAYPRFPGDTPVGDVAGTVVITDADIPPVAG